MLGYSEQKIGPPGAPGCAAREKYSVWQRVIIWAYHRFVVTPRVIMAVRDWSHFEAMTSATSDENDVTLTLH